MNTLPKDLLILIFKQCCGSEQADPTPSSSLRRAKRQKRFNNNDLVDPFSLLYGHDFLRIKYQQVCQYIDGELCRLFGEHRYKIFNEDSVLTGSFLLKLILGEHEWFHEAACKNINIVTRTEFETNNLFILDTGRFAPICYSGVRTLKNIQDFSGYFYKKDIKDRDILSHLNVTTIDDNKITIKKYIQDSDYDFLLNYAYYKDKQLQLFVGNYLSVFNKESEFNISDVIWESPERFKTYRCRGFNIKWNPGKLEQQIDEYIGWIRCILSTGCRDFLITSSSSSKMFRSTFSKAPIHIMTMEHIKMFIFTDLMKGLLEV